MTAKSDIIGWIAAGRLRHDRMTPVTWCTPAAQSFLTVRKTSAGTWEGSPYVADEWITEVYVRTGEGWRCALSQKTPVRSEG
ncbi:hypothetical protein ACQP2P_33325 [Dactylosporangium sp. CA-139114]|uniref:hypothetical protein n=1 Tax=Dactylosporangium sp. CA-139114 TaxID=3239931 RepID=UPI003D98CEE4